MTPVPRLRAALEHFMRLDADRLRSDPAGFALLLREAQAAGQQALATGRPTPATRVEVREALSSFCVFGR